LANKRKAFVKILTHIPVIDVLVDTAVLGKTNETCSVKLPRFARKISIKMPGHQANIAVRSQMTNLEPYIPDVFEHMLEDPRHRIDPADLV